MPSSCLLTTSQAATAAAGSGVFSWHTLGHLLAGLLLTVSISLWPVYPPSDGYVQQEKELCHEAQIFSTWFLYWSPIVTRSQSNSAPMGCARTGDSHMTLQKHVVISNTCSSLYAASDVFSLETSTSLKVRNELSRLSKCNNIYKIWWVTDILLQPVTFGRHFPLRHFRINSKMILL